MKALIQKYILGRRPKDESQLSILQELTERLIASESAPKSSLMQTIIELSANGVLALDKNGVILFFNPSAEDMLRTNGEIKGLPITDLVPSAEKKTLKEIIKNPPERKLIKVPVVSKSGEIRRVLDLVIYKVDNDDYTRFIVFVAECIEFSIFNCHPCPNNESCEFFKRYGHLFVGTKLPIINN